VKPWWCEVLRSQIPDANLREEIKRGLGVKGKDFIFGKKERKRKKVQWELGVEAEREERHNFLTFLFI